MKDLKVKMKGNGVSPYPAGLLKSGVNFYICSLHPDSLGLDLQHVTNQTLGYLEGGDACLQKKITQHSCDSSIMNCDQDVLVLIVNLRCYDNLMLLGSNADGGQLVLGLGPVQLEHRRPGLGHQV